MLGRDRAGDLPWPSGARARCTSHPGRRGICFQTQGLGQISSVVTATLVL